MITWDEAIQQAKQELGIIGYTENWDGVVELAKEIIWEAREKNPREYEDRDREAKEFYEDRLKSKSWKEFRSLVFEKKGNKCKDCGGEATQIHHNSYNHLDTPWEIYEVDVLCAVCHERRHNK